jgi:hypothetical protein
MVGVCGFGKEVWEIKFLSGKETGTFYDSRS